MQPALILPFANRMPTFATPPVFAGPRSAVLGRATIGGGASLGEDSVVRADGEEIHLGDDVFLGHRATVHIVHEEIPTRIGRNVTVGANCCVHACTVGDDCVFEENVVILDGATIEAGVLIEANATVFPRKTLDGGFVYAGSPAKPVRPLAPGERAERAAAIRARQGSERALPDVAQDFGADVFVASTSQRFGRVACQPGSSLFFSCVADAGTGSIFVGANTNVQDNTVMRAGDGEIVVGRDTTIGHNVRMAACRVGDRALVGIGAVLAAGAWVQDDVLVAAGTITEPGQVCESGWLWGGRPAKAMSRLDEARRAGMAENVRTYCGYAQTFRRLQAEHAPERV